MFLRKLSLISGLPSRFHILHRKCDMHLFEIKTLYVAHRRKSEDRKLSMQIYNSSYDFLVLSYMHTFVKEV